MAMLPTMLGKDRERWSMSVDDGAWLAELLIEIETDPDDTTRIRLIDGLQRVLG